MESINDVTLEKMLELIIKKKEYAYIE